MGDCHWVRSDSIRNTHNAKNKGIIDFIDVQKT